MPLSGRADERALCNTRPVTEDWFTAAENAAPETVAAIYRGALAAQRARIQDFHIDVLSDRPWPAEVMWAVREMTDRLAEARNRPRPWLLRWLPRSDSPTIALDLERDPDFELAAAIAPYTIGGTGLADGRIIYDVNDTGTSAAFRLTTAEVDDAKRFVSIAGADPKGLVRLARTKP